MSRGMVCAPQPEAVEAGVDILNKGGNAVDAAIACALVQTAVDPQMCGIAGFGSMHLYLPKTGYHGFIDFHGRAPEKATETMWTELLEGETEDGFGFILKGAVNEVGYQSITTPGTLKAFDEALGKYGTKSLAELLEPAIGYAEDGFIVRPHVANFWNLDESVQGRQSTKDKLVHTEAGRKIYLDENGNLRMPGQLHKNPDMASTYRRIAEEGADVFYKGAIAKTIAEDMQRHGGLITESDLANFATETLPPLWGEYRGHKIATCNPPGGGIMVLQMLNILENFDLKAMGHNSAEYISVVSEAMKIATVDKDKFVGDPRFVDIPIARLLDKGYAKECADKIKRGEKTSVPRLKADKESRDTTHISTVDHEGNCVSLTLGMPSGVVTEGLGFMYNGCMAVFDPRPGQTNSIHPGKARFTSMAPTIVFKNDQPEIIIGAPGGTYIAMGVLQGILNAIDFGMSSLEAVAAARFCTTSDIIDVTNRITRGSQRQLEERGYNVRRSYLSYHFAGVHMISKDSNGNWQGGADPGRDGMALAAD